MHITVSRSCNYFPPEGETRRQVKYARAFSRLFAHEMGISILLKAVIVVYVARYVSPRAIRDRPRFAVGKYCKLRCSFEIDLFICDVSSPVRSNLVDDQPD
jgi:hypothetical protein